MAKSNFKNFTVGNKRGKRKRKERKQMVGQEPNQVGMAKGIIIAPTA